MFKFSLVYFSDGRLKVELAGIIDISVSCRGLYKLCIYPLISGKLVQRLGVALTESRKQLCEDLRAVCSRVSSQCEAWSFCPLFCWSKVLCRLFGGWPWSQVLTGGCLWGMHAAGPRCILAQFWSDGGLFCFYCPEWRHTTCTVGKGFVVSPCWMRPWVSHDLETIVLPCWLLIDVHLTIAPSRSFVKSFTTWMNHDR